MKYADNEIIKLCSGKVELPAAEVEKIYLSGERWIIQFRTVYQLNYSENAGYYTQKVLYIPKSENYVPITLRGHFITADGDFANRLTGRTGFCNF